MCSKTQGRVVVTAALGFSHAVTCSCFSHVRLFATLWTVDHQAPLSMGFSRQEYWNGLPCPPPGDLSHPGSNLHLLCLLHWQEGSFITTATWIQSLLCDKHINSTTTNMYPLLKVYQASDSH